MGWVPARERASGCWTVCTQWNRLLCNTAVFGWTCVQCNKRMAATARMCEAAWFRAHVNSSMHVCFGCAFKLHQRRRIVDWRCYDIDHVLFSQRSLRVRIGTTRSWDKGVPPKHKIPGCMNGVPREFCIRLPPCLIHVRSYQPIDDSDRKNVGFMFLYNCRKSDGSFYLEDVPITLWPRPTFFGVYKYGTDPCPVYLSLSFEGKFAVTSIPNITGYHTLVGIAVGV